MAFDCPKLTPGPAVGTLPSGRQLGYVHSWRGEIFPKFELKIKRYSSCGAKRCPINGDRMTTLWANPHAAPYYRNAHLYSVQAEVSVMLVSGTVVGCTYVPDLPTLPGKDVCGEYLGLEFGYAFEAPYFDVSVHGGPWLDYTGTSVVTEYEDDKSSADGNTGPIFQGYRASVSAPNWAQFFGSFEVTRERPNQLILPKMAYLENPDPVWPIPDAQGSTFGRALFRRDQIPWELSATFVHHNHDADRAQLRTLVKGYILGRPTRRPGSVGVLAGSPGTRKRGRIVGQGGDPIG